MNPKRPHTLIIEDDEDYSGLLKTFLNRREESFLVSQVRTMREALERLTGDPFDLIILDLHLPDGQGLELFDSIRAVAPAAAILIVSGATDEEDFALKAVERGAQDYLIKGDFDWKTFMRSIHYAITRKKMEEDLRQNFSELKSVEEKLRDTNAVLEHKIRQLDRMVHIMTGREERILQLKEENRSLKGGVSVSREN